MEPQDDKKMTQEQVWVIGWFCLISSAFLFAMGFAMADFPTFVYRTSNAFGFAALTCGVGSIFTVFIRSIPR
jgi:hypothetical protein